MHPKHVKLPDKSTIVQWAHGYTIFINTRKSIYYNYIRRLTICTFYNFLPMNTISQSCFHLPYFSFFIDFCVSLNHTLPIILTLSMNIHQRVKTVSSRIFFFLSESKQAFYLGTMCLTKQAFLTKYTKVSVTANLLCNVITYAKHNIELPTKWLLCTIHYN